ncbi:MAG: NH(3)-dependent NAD(+) synthetase [Candidatus Peregrinibacteria bacterium GW2011_GWA2_47_7]|nr:MAG: NH(3)-dependent NAD(+) synthetase [Candidatus Peregrinibacteria bacterium GW2011_GWA2_47_7]
MEPTSSTPVISATLAAHTVVTAPVVAQTVIAQPVAAKPAAAQQAVEKPVAKPKIEKPNWDGIYQKLVKGVKKYFEETHFKRGVLGLSGGVDSALTLKIAVDALGADNVTALIMPELGITKQENIDHAKVLCEFLGVVYHYQPINGMVSEFRMAPWSPSQLASMNTKARIRAVMLYSYANTDHALVLGTSNKSELLLGYGTKYGDLAADIEVIADLYKTEVIKLADHIGMPPEIVNKAPSAELAAGQTDEEEIGAPYQDLDKVLQRLDMGQEWCVSHGLPIALVQLVFRLFEQNRHKTELPHMIFAK